MMLSLSLTRYSWHYKAWQKTLAGYMRAFAQNNQPNKNMIGYVINDKHPKTIRVQCERCLYSVRYQKSFRISKKVWVHDEKGDCHLGDIVKVQPIGHRIGPWKTYVVVEILYREPRDELTHDRSYHKISDDELSDLEDNDEDNLFNTTLLKNHTSLTPTKGYFNLSDTIVSNSPIKNDHQLMAFRQQDYKFNHLRQRRFLQFLKRH